MSPCTLTIKIYCLTVAKVPRNLPKPSWIRQSTKFTPEIENSIKTATSIALVIVTQRCSAISFPNRAGLVLLYRCVNLIKRTRDVFAPGLLEIKVEFDFHSYIRYFIKKNSLK